MDSIKHAKEKTDMILEPMQAIVQLALLSFCPVGTKICVTGNILYLQMPTVYQGALRWWQGDTKDDLYYLFHVVRRYYRWYPTSEDSMYGYFLERAKLGIEKLIQTYKQTDRTSIIHTLSLYKNVLKIENQDLFEDKNADVINIDNVFENIKSIYSKHNHMLVLLNIISILE